MIAVPILLSLFTALAILLFRRKPHIFRTISLAGSGIIFAVACQIFYQVESQGPMKMHFAGWEAPFAISFYVDTLSALMILVAALMGLCGNIAAVAILTARLELRGFHSLYHFMMLGVFGAFSTGDLFNLYVWFEIILISSFVFVALSRHRHAYAGAFKYSVLSIISSLFFLIGIAFVYVGAGTLDMQHLSELAKQGQQGSQMLFAVFFLGVAFAIKAGLFPFYFWLPASYSQTLTPIAAVFSGLLTKVGVYAILRVLISPLLLQAPEVFPLLYVVALASMLLGVLGALAQNTMKGILSFHIISQVGYIVLGLSLGSFFGVVACVFYLTHHIVVKTNLFFATSYVEQLTGTRAQLNSLGNLWEKAPWAAVLFAISALSLVGIPPLSGFWAKVLTIQATLAGERWVGFFFCLGVSLLTLMSMLKIWLAAFWKPPEGPLQIRPLTFRQSWILVPLALLNIWTIGMGLQYERFKTIGEKISVELNIERVQK